MGEGSIGFQNPDHKSVNLRYKRYSLCTLLVLETFRINFWNNSSEKSSDFFYLFLINSGIFSDFFYRPFSAQKVGIRSISSISTPILKELNSHLRPKKSSKKGSTAPRVPKSSLTSVLTGPVAA